MGEEVGKLVVGSRVVGEYEGALVTPVTVGKLVTTEAVLLKTYIGPLTMVEPSTFTKLVLPFIKEPTSIPKKA